jgi:ATP-dependent DNA helicase RecG
MKLSQIQNTIETLPGLGPAKAKLFARLNIFTIGDLLSTYPKSYEDRTKKIPLCQFQLHPKVYTICKVTGHDWFGYGRMKTLKIQITDGTANAFLIAFNRAFLQKSLPVGSIVRVSGKFEERYGQLQSSAFDTEVLAQEGTLEDFSSPSLLSTGMVPVYPLTEGLTQKIYHKAVSTALKLYGKSIEDELPPSVIQERKLLSKSETLFKIHQGSTPEDIKKARESIIYEELFLFEYKLAKSALDHRGRLPALDLIAPGEKNGVQALTALGEDSSQEENEEQLDEKFRLSLSPHQQDLLSRLPFSLTPDQKRVILDLNRDVDRSQGEANTMITAPEKLSHNPFSMQRLLQGDVGSGKTLVAFFLCLRVIDYGGQCAILAPTELLAKQHAENAARMLEVLGIKVAFLTGNLKSKGRDNLLNALKDGFINIVIGTHALFSQNVCYKKLQLAVIDEQHRFGVAQRESIVQKGRISSGSLTHSPDLLMMSATPIPQTLALTVFGDLDVSVIKSMPEGRKPIKTYLSVMGHEANAYEAVRKELKAGHQAYFVYPRIGEDEEEAESENSSHNQEKGSSDLKSAEEMFAFLSGQVYPEYKCALIHSKVTEEEQSQILEDFRTGKIQILVATTVVEVGVDVANANCMVIEHADRFGLAALHQLRGRVGRSSLQSYCFLIYSKSISQTGKDRLMALHESTDGFRIAEEDLKLRGPGEVSGTLQSGYLSLGLADLIRDKECLKIARYDAFNYIRAKYQL